MLILSRKVDESIIIGDNIEVKIISIDKGMVKIGIEAPSSVSILRSELLKEVENSNKAASVHVDDAVLESFYKKFSK
ncbi:carbon storage regulator CsrA [Sulfurimonas sp. HSL3-2]|jgi:carbon storage regulator CsrA|uniref:carbon storage regulator CsrA n=1 Tax=Hydrocurvibacter mobilis TaxID=3131936 RepID=UPI0031F89F02